MWLFPQPGRIMVCNEAQDFHFLFEEIPSFVRLLFFPLL